MDVCGLVGYIYERGFIVLERSTAPRWHNFSIASSQSLTCRGGCLTTASMDLAFPPPGLLTTEAEIVTKRLLSFDVDSS